ncbi:hypothetical protein IMZ48_25940 [Candidatus Bathyarchaeota archaeon]|nr:hypothetical protein [Candidatus Bathyarchaeota archaeon]
MYVEDGDELKLICEPFTIPSAPNTTILYRRAYDLYTIGIFRAGKITLKTSFLPEHDVPGGRMLVLIVEWRKKLDNAVPVPTYGHRLVGSVTLPLEFHRSSSCMLVCEGDFPLEISRDAMVRIAGTPAETGTGDHADEQVGAHGAGHGGTSLGGAAGVAADTSGGGTGAALPTLPAGQLMHNATYSRPPADLDAGDHPMSASDEEDAAWDLDYIPVEGGEGRRAKRRRGRR